MNIETNDCRDRGYAHDQKRPDAPLGEVWPQSKRIRS